MLATGAMFAAETLPRLLFGSVAGVFVDRWERKKTMGISDLSRALILLPLLAVAAGGPLALVYAVAFVEASVFDASSWQVVGAVRPVPPRGGVTAQDATVLLALFTQVFHGPWQRPPRIHEK